MYAVDLLQNFPIDFNGELKNSIKSTVVADFAADPQQNLQLWILNILFFITLAKNLQQNLHVLERIYLWKCCGFAAFLTRVEAA